MTDRDFWRGKRVFVTGHTGFKGGWLVQMLLRFGADVTGYALLPEEMPNLYAILRPERKIASVIGDVRDFKTLAEAFDTAKPEIVFHLAAQPIVRESYRRPRETYETNVMGTVNLLECVRRSDTVRSVVNVTTDKVYLNAERATGYREDEPLNGFDPYSNSKSCSDLATQSYARCFFADGSTAVSTARAGNVIGGGDFSRDRIVPDCIRAAMAGTPVTLRNPSSIRPYQHVLEPLSAYLLLARAQYESPALAGCYNVGPGEADCVTTEKLAALFCSAWGEGAACLTQQEPNAPHEASYLKLDSGKFQRTFGWKPRLSIAEAVQQTVDWTKAWRADADMVETTRRQIQNFYGDQDDV